MCCKNAEQWCKGMLQTSKVLWCQLVRSWHFWNEKDFHGVGKEGVLRPRKLTNPSQLLMATEAPGTSVMSPVKVQSVLSSSRRSILSVPLVDSVWLAPTLESLPPLPFLNPGTSSCHSTIAPGATSLLFGRRRRWNSFPKAVMLKKSLCSVSPFSSTSLLTRCLWVAESRCDR